MDIFKNCPPLIKVIFVMVFVIFFVDMQFHTQIRWESIQPATNWVEYYSVEAEKETYVIGEDMYVTSDLEVKRDATLSWSDVLYCDHDHRPNFGEEEYYERYVEFQSASFEVEKGERKITKPWRYATQLPQKPASCYIDSCTVVLLEDGARKTRCLQSPKIRFE